MDLSREYIRMCEKAEEIQASWIDAVDTGDIYFIRYKNGKLSHRRFSPLIGGYKPIDASRAGKRAIWLPRQDQLQKMVKKETETYKALMARLLNTGYLTPVEWSMEQLWLAFVMLTLYHKKWSTGKAEWVKEEVAVGSY